MAERRRRELDPEMEVALSALSAMLQTRDGRRRLLVLAIVGLLAYGAWLLYQRYGRPHTPIGPTVRLATWNLHEFSPRPQIDLRRIAQIIQDNHFDLLAIQEVRGTGEEVDNLLNALGYPWKAASYSPTTGNHERFAFIYNSDHIEEIGPAEPVTRAYGFARTPYEDTFRAGNFSFTVVTVHLEWTKKSLREAEARELAAMLPDLSSRAPQRHLIVLGDFNEEHAHSNLHYLTSAGFESLIHDPTNLSSTEDFDNVLVDPRSLPEFTGQSGVVAFDQTYQYTHHQAVEAISDHRPAWADFSTDQPVQPSNAGR